MSREKENKAALDKLLGLSNSAESDVYKSLQNKVKDTSSTADEALLAEAWQNLAQKKAQLDQVTMPRPSLFETVQTWFSLPKLGMLSGMAAAVVIAVTVVLNPSGQTKMVLLSSANKGKAIDLTKEFHSDDGEPLLAQVGSVKLWFRGVAGFLLEEGLEKKKFSFRKGSVLFQYDSINKQPVSIVTPHATFSIVGTEFFLRTQKEETHLVVFEGRVQVESSKGKVIVAPNQVYKTLATKVVALPAKRSAQILKAFKDNKQKNETFIKLYQTTPLKKARRYQIVSVEMKNGQLFKGKLIKNKADSISLIYLEGADPITLRKSEIKTFKIGSKK